MSNYTYLKAHHQKFVSAALPALVEIADIHAVSFTLNHERLEDAFAAFVLAYTDDVARDPGGMRERPRDGTSHAQLDVNHRVFLADLIPEILRVAAFHRVELTLDDRHLEDALAACVVPGSGPFSETPLYSATGHIVGYEQPTTGTQRFRTGRPSLKH